MDCTMAILTSDGHESGLNSLSKNAELPNSRESAQSSIRRSSELIPSLTKSCSAGKLDMAWASSGEYPATEASTVIGVGAGLGGRGGMVGVGVGAGVGV